MFLALAHMVGATRHHVSCTCTHGRCYATSCFLHLHTWSVLRNCVCLVIAHMVDATQHHVSCTCTHGGCYATSCFLHLRLEEYVWSFLFRMNARPKLLEATGQIGPKSKQCYKIEKKTSFFRRMRPKSTNSIVYFFFKTRTHGKNGTKSTYEQTDHTWKSTPSQHFVHLEQNAMLISLRVAITAVTLFLDHSQSVLLADLIDKSQPAWCTWHPHLAKKPAKGTCWAKTSHCLRGFSTLYLDGPEIFTNLHQIWPIFFEIRGPISLPKRYILGAQGGEVAII